MFFNFTGDFCRSSARPVNDDDDEKKNAVSNNSSRGQFKIDGSIKTITTPVLEYVFVSLDALSNLLEKSLAVLVSFVDPKQFLTMTNGQTEACALKKNDLIMGNSTAMSEEWVQKCFYDGGNRHSYWKLKLRCGRNGH